MIYKGEADVLSISLLLRHPLALLLPTVLTTLLATLPRLPHPGIGMTQNTKQNGSSVDGSFRAERIAASNLDEPRRGARDANRWSRHDRVYPTQSSALGSLSPVPIALRSHHAVSVRQSTSQVVLSTYCFEYVAAEERMSPRRERMPQRRRLLRVGNGGVQG